MRIEYLGHACFHFTDAKGTTVIVDPFDETVGFRVPLKRADYTLITHGHWDHGNLSMVSGATHVVQGAGRRGDERLPVTAVLAYHDDVCGARNGLCNLMCFAMDGLRVCHLSDLGCALDASQLREIGAVDVLLVPVGGGGFTIDAAGAVGVVGQLGPRVIIPMHYMTPQTNRRDFPIDAVDPFLASFKNVERVRSGVLDLTPSTMPIRQTVYVLTNTC